MSSVFNIFNFTQNCLRLFWRPMLYPTIWEEKKLPTNQLSITTIRIFFITRRLIWNIALLRCYFYSKVSCYPVHAISHSSLQQGISDRNASSKCCIAHKLHMRHTYVVLYYLINKTKGTIWHYSWLKIHWTSQNRICFCLINSWEWL